MPRNLRAAGIAWVKISRDVRRIRPSADSREKCRHEGEKPGRPRKTCLHKSLLRGSAGATRLFDSLREDRREMERKRDSEERDRSGLSFGMAGSALSICGRARRARFIINFSSPPRNFSFTVPEEAFRHGPRTAMLVWRLTLARESGDVRSVLGSLRCGYGTKHRGSRREKVERKSAARADAVEKFDFRSRPLISSDIVDRALSDGRVKQPRLLTSVSRSAKKWSSRSAVTCQPRCSSLKRCPSVIPKRDKFLA